VTPQAFIAAISPAAVTLAGTSKIPASFTVAEAALESGWGAHCPGFNIFGIKADASWHGPVTTDQTDEVENGEEVTITAKFRAYPSWLASLEDHAQFLLTNPRYQPAFAYTTGALFAQAVAAAGYATDPLYAQKIIEIIKAHNLSALDVA
jgi:flagellum-specific peptidoglycan hydrolase FlgJ